MIDRAEILYSPAYKNLSCSSYAVSSLDGTKRHMVSGPPLRHTFVTHGNSPTLPGLSFILQHQRSPQDYILSPSSLPPSQDPVRVTTPCNEDGSDHLQYNSAYRRKIGPKPVQDPDHVRIVTVSTVTATVTPPSLILTTPVQKSSRYLREMDRRVILSRIEQGEKQSALAKEYKVSRAAICNLNKHRNEVLSRKNGNPLAKHPKKPRSKTMKAKVGKSYWTMRENNAQEQNSLYVIKSRAAALLLTTLRKKHATMCEFRRSSDRLMRIVMEEALAHVPMKTVEILSPNHSKLNGVALQHPPCVVSMEPTGCPMLDLFHLMEPDQPTGYVSFGDIAASPSDLQSHDVQAKICGSRLPDSLNYHNVFVMDHVVTSAEVVIAVVRRLQEHGAVETMISLVALIATAEAVKQVHAVFPALKIVVLQVESGEVAGPSTEHIDAEAMRMSASTTDMILDRLEQVYHGLPPTNTY